MGFRIDHLTPHELAGVRDGSDRRVMDREHLRACPECRLRMAESLLLRHLARQDSSIAANHLSSADLDWYHQVTFEAADDHVDLDRLLSIDQHLRACSDCFARFMHWHERLAPGPALIDRAVASYRAARRMQPLGTLTLAPLLDRLVLRFRHSRATRRRERRQAAPMERALESASSPFETPAAVYDRPALYDMATDLDTSAHATRAVMHYEPEPAPAEKPAEVGAVRRAPPVFVEVGPWRIMVTSKVDATGIALVLRAKPTREDAGLAPLVAVLADDSGPIGVQQQTDSGGRLRLPVDPRADRLWLTLPGQQTPYEIRLAIAPGLFPQQPPSK
jgi:hypothetical protein